MSIVTYEATYVLGRADEGSVRHNPEGFWSRLFRRVSEARLRQAEEYLAQHRHLLADPGQTGTRH